MSDPKPDPKALHAAAVEVSATWDNYVTLDDDAGFDEHVRAIGSLRQVLDGTRRMRLSKDQYDCWRSRCSCGWPGSPHGDRGAAVHEFAFHQCDDSQEG